MGQSYVTGNGSEIEVRDSTFELVLDRLLVELEAVPPDDIRDRAEVTVRTWTEYWRSMPPGCKELDICELPLDIRYLLKTMLARVQEGAPAGSETALVAQQFGDVLSRE